MEIVLALLVIVAAIVLAVVALRRGLSTTSAGPRPRPWEDEAARGETIVLDIGSADPEDPAVQRLVREAGMQALRSDPQLDRVRVVSRDSTLLGEVQRPQPLPELDLPEQLHEPHAARHHGPAVVRGERLATPTVSRGDDAYEPSPRRRDFADRFQLPPAVTAALANRDNPTELVRAVLVAGGYSPEVDGDLVVVDNLAIVIVPDVLDRANEALNHAFLRCQEARKPQGLVIRLGWVNAEDLRHREAAAPWVRHVDSDAIQRMADAVAVGADPVAFAVGPRVVRA